MWYHSFVPHCKSLNAYSFIHSFIHSFICSFIHSHWLMSCFIHTHTQRHSSLHNHNIHDLPAVRVVTGMGQWTSAFQNMPVDLLPLASCSTLPLHFSLEKDAFKPDFHHLVDFNSVLCFYEFSQHTLALGQPAARHYSTVLLMYPVYSSLGKSIHFLLYPVHRMT